MLYSYSQVHKSGQQNYWQNLEGTVGNFLRDKKSTIHRMTFVVFLRFIGHLLPLHNVCWPLHVPLGKQLLAVDPNIINPLSQLNSIEFGYVVSFPNMLPFCGVGM